MAISMLKIRRPLGRLIFNMGIAIPGKTVFLIETAPRLQSAIIQIHRGKIVHGNPKIEAETKWPTFCRRHFQFISLMEIFEFRFKFH